MRGDYEQRKDGRSWKWDLSRGDERVDQGEAVRTLGMSSSRNSLRRGVIREIGLIGEGIEGGAMTELTKGKRSKESAMNGSRKSGGEVIRVLGLFGDGVEGGSIKHER